MKRLLTVLAMASIFAAAPAVADYDSCMKYCIPEHGFDHCNPICAGGEKKADGEENNVNRESANNFGPCKTGGEKKDAIFAYLEKHYGASLVLMYTSDDHPNNIVIDFDLDEETNCTGTFTVTANCDLLPNYQCESIDKAQ